jgi:hypothetical protein
LPEGRTEGDWVQNDAFNVTHTDPGQTLSTGIDSRHADSCAAGSQQRLMASSDYHFKRI